MLYVSNKGYAYSVLSVQETWCYVVEQKISSVPSSFFCPSWCLLLQLEIWTHQLAALA